MAVAPLEVTKHPKVWRIRPKALGHRVVARSMPVVVEVVEGVDVWVVVHDAVTAAAFNVVSDFPPALRAAQACTLVSQFGTVGVKQFFELAACNRVVI